MIKNLNKLESIVAFLLAESLLIESLVHPRANRLLVVGGAHAAAVTGISNSEELLHLESPRDKLLDSVVSSSHDRTDSRDERCRSGDGSETNLETSAKVVPEAELHEIVFILASWPHDVTSCLADLIDASLAALALPLARADLVEIHKHDVLLGELAPLGFCELTGLIPHVFGSGSIGTESILGNLGKFLLVRLESSSSVLPCRFGFSHLLFTPLLDLRDSSVDVGTNLLKLGGILPHLLGL